MKREDTGIHPELVSSTRRQFLAAGGALVLAFSLRPYAGLAQGQAKPDAKPGAPSAPKLPGDLDKTALLDAWIRIAADGSITVFTGKAELGQGIKTALAQIAAEQLGVAIGRINMITADTERTPDEGYTAGSHSMQDSGTAIMHAAAQVREILIDEAAKRLEVPRERLQARDGFVQADAGHRVSYGELVAGQVLNVKARDQSALKDPAAHVIMGKPTPRLDIPGKVTGGVAYVQDLRLPGMVHARAVRPPAMGAHLQSADMAAVQKLPGVLKIVRDGDYVAVVAEREYQAVLAMRALEDSAQWTPGPKLPPSSNIHTLLMSFPVQDSVILDKGSTTGAAMTEATYHRPYQIHGSIGPSCAVAKFEAGKLTVWTHTQGVYPLRAALAEMLGMKPEDVHCIHMEGSGCYGHNGADDVAADAALIARAMPDRPVRVQWMRDQEHAWEPFGPAMITRLRGAVDASGRITAWEHEVWSNTHNGRPGKAGNLVAAQLLATPFTPPPPMPIPQPEGGGDRNAIPLYAVPNARVVSHFIPEMPLRVSALRGLGAYMNVFSIESFIDELAVQSKIDPVEFRLRNLDDPRAQDVIRNAATRFGWASYKRTAGRGRGFSFARYKNLAGYLAIAMEVEVDASSGEIQVGRVVAAADSGMAVNPDGIVNQIEGGIVQSLSWTLMESVTWDEARITSRDWGRYPILRMPQVPKSIDVQIIDRPGQPFLGTGEVAQGPTSAALANAVFDACGARIRDLPLEPKKVSAAARKT